MKSVNWWHHKRSASLRTHVDNVNIFKPRQREVLQNLTPQTASSATVYQPSSGFIELCVAYMTLEVVSYGTIMNRNLRRPTRLYC